jgi:hypothetical protein
MTEGTKMKLAEIETLDHLKDFVTENMPGASVVFDGDEVVIRTGFGIDLGNILHVLNEEG